MPAWALHANSAWRDARSAAWLGALSAPLRRPAWSFDREACSLRRRGSVASLPVNVKTALSGPFGVSGTAPWAGSILGGVDVAALRRLDDDPGSRLDGAGHHGAGAVRKLG